MARRQYYFIRHALPINDAGMFHLNSVGWNAVGDGNAPLSQKGRQQAGELKDAIIALDIERIVSSTKARAIETAEIVSAATGITYAHRFDGLSEINLGRVSIKKNWAMRGMTSRYWPKMARKPLDQGLISALTGYYYLQWYLGNTNGGETLPSIFHRAEGMLKTLDAFSERRIAVVGHAGWIAFLAVRILGRSPWNLLRLSRVANCSLTRVDADGCGGYKLVFFARPPDAVGPSYRPSLLTSIRFG